MNDVDVFESALRAAVPTKPDPVLQPAFVRRLAAVARAATVEAEAQANGRPTWARGAGRRRPRLALAARVGIAVAAIPLALAGLAFAGVNLPQPARDAFDSVGVSLPNQPSEHSRATDQGTGGNEVSDAAKSGPSGDRGNSAVAHQHARAQRLKARGKAIGLNELTPPGLSGDTGPSANANPRSAGTQSSKGGRSSRPFPPRARGKALGHSK